MRRVTLMAAAAAAAGLLVLAARQAGLPPRAAVIAAAGLALLLLPFGMAAIWPATRELSRPERWVAAACAGYPLSTAAFQVLSWAGAPIVFAVLWAAVAAIAVRHWRVEKRAAPLQAGLHADTARLAAGVIVIAAGILVLWTRHSRAFVPVAEGQAYRHSVDHAVHLALYWEMARGLPPRQLPTAAGLPFPSYHTLSFVPGVLLVRHGGLQMTTVYHAVSPLLRLALLMGAAYLVVRLRTGDRRLGLAALPALLVLGPWIEQALGPRIVAGPSPYYFFARNESGGGAIVVWAVVAFLLALYERHRHPAAVAAAAVAAGVAFGFKAQMFLLFAPPFFLALGWMFLRERRRHVAAAVALGLGAFALVFWAARGQGPLGTLHFTPGLFVRLYVYPALAADPSPWIRRDLLGFLAGLPAAAGMGLASALAVWRLASFAPAAPWIAVDRLRRFRTAGPLDVMFVLVLVVAVPLGVCFSAVSIDREVSPFEFMQAAHGLAFWAAVLNVIALGRLLDRWGRDGGALTLAIVLGLSAAVVPVSWRGAKDLPPREAIVIGADEACALRFVRERTPWNAVTVGWRDLPVEEGGPPKRLNHQAVLGGIAGRRTVLEYYGPQVDPRTDRERAVRQLFTAADPERGMEILDRYGVSHVVEYPGRPLAFDSPRLSTVYTRGAVRVREVRGETGTGAATSKPPRAWAETPDLACPDEATE